MISKPTSIRFLKMYFSTSSVFNTCLQRMPKQAKHISTNTKQRGTHSVIQLLGGLATQHFKSLRRTAPANAAWKEAGNPLRIGRSNRERSSFPAQTFTFLHGTYGATNHLSCLAQRPSSNREHKLQSFTMGIQGHSPPKQNHVSLGDRFSELRQANWVRNGAEESRNAHEVHKGS